MKYLKTNKIMRITIESYGKKYSVETTNHLYCNQCLTERVSIEKEFNVLKANIKKALQYGHE